MEPADSSDRLPASPQEFATTCWSVVLAAGGELTPLARAAWEKLARAWWQPLYAHVRRRAFAHAEAQDLVQGFFARMIGTCAVRQACRERGRFRTFLLAALDHFLANEHDRATALKRGGGRVFVSWPVEEGEPEIEPALPGKPPGWQFDREWAQAVFRRALGQLEAEFATDGKATHFAALKLLFHPPAPGEYEAVAAGLGLRPGLMATVVSRLRLRLRLRALVRAEIAHTVATVSEVEEEVRYLVELIAG